MNHRGRFCIPDVNFGSGNDLPFRISDEAYDASRTDCLGRKPWRNEQEGRRKKQASRKTASVIEI